MSSPSGDNPTRARSRPRRRRRRRRAIVAAVALVAILAAGVAVSWYFSSEVLVPERSDRSADVTIEGISAGRVVLTRSEDTERPGVYGLDWQTGHAIIGEVLSSDARTVTRRLRSDNGYLVTGMKVALDPDVYVGNPKQALGLTFEEVNVPGELGPMPAWLIPAAPAARTSTWAIVVHGINGNLEGDLQNASALHRDGLPALLITYREDLGAPRSPDGLHHMGLTEWRDLEAAARYALAHGARRLVLIGWSMGGSIVAQFMERSPLKNKVAGLVLDAPALNWKAILEYNATEMGLPALAAKPVEWMIDARIDADWNSLDALRHPDDFHLPILLFHGTEDKTVPIKTSDELAKELPHWVTYYRVPKAGHVESWNVDPALYEQRLTDFLARITGITGTPADTTRR